MRRWHFFPLIVGVVAACSSNTPSACTPGQQVACACPGAGQGAQACNADGSGFLACQCDVGSDDGGNEAAVNDAAGDGNVSDASAADATADSADAACPYNADPNDTVDHDHDGQSVAEGDCNDCDPTVYAGDANGDCSGG